MNTIKEAADYAAQFMKDQGIIVQRYDARSTHSIYLKFDYGVLNTVRFSDHKSKDHLHYRYNIRTDIEEYYQDGIGATERNYFPLSQVEKCMRMILVDKFCKIGRWGLIGYNRIRDNKVDKMAHSQNRFWKSCTHV